jgi:uncharacterized protein (TIRG00374 family)
LRRRRIWFQLALVLAFVGLLAWRVNLGNAFRTFGDVHYGWVAAALAVFTISKLVYTIRWRILLGRNRGLPLSDLFGIYLVSKMVNTVLPLRTGDLVRIQVPARRYNIHRVELTAVIIVVETLLDGVAYVILLLAGLGLQDVPAVRQSVLWTLVALVALGAGLAALAARIRLPDDLSQVGWGRLLPGWLRQRVPQLVPPFVDGLAALRDPRIGARAIAISFPAWLIETLVFWLFGQAFGLGLGFGAYLLITVAANLIVAVPITPTSIGLYEVALQEVVALFGVDRSLATGYAIGTHVFTSLWIAATGLVATWLLHFRFEELFYLRGEEERPAAAGMPAADQ